MLHSAPATSPAETSGHANIEVSDTPSTETAFFESPYGSEGAAGTSSELEPMSPSEGAWAGEATIPASATPLDESPKATRVSCARTPSRLDQAEASLGRIQLTSPPAPHHGASSLSPTRPTMRPDGGSRPRSASLPRWNDQEESEPVVCHRSLLSRYMELSAFHISPASSLVRQQ